MSQQSQQVGKCHSKVTIPENVRNILSETTVHMRQFGETHRQLYWLALDCSLTYLTNDENSMTGLHDFSIIITLLKNLKSQTRSLAARDNRKVRLVTHSGHLI